MKIRYYNTDQIVHWEGKGNYSFCPDNGEWYLQYSRDGLSHANSVHLTEDKLDNPPVVNKNKKLKKGARILVKADEILGTEEAMATVKKVHSWGYTVHIDGDDPEWDGPVNFAGEILQEMPF